MANENGLAARRVFCRTSFLIGAADLEISDIGVVEIDLIVGNDAAALDGLGKALWFPLLADEGDPNDVRPRGYGDVDFEAGIAANLHVFFPGVVAGESGLARAGIAGGGGTALSLAADPEPFQKLPIQADVELLGPSHSFDVVLILALEADFEAVFAIDREVMLDGDTAAGAEGEIFALAVVLKDVERDLESIHSGAGGR